MYTPIYSFENGISYDDSLYADGEPHTSKTATVPFESIQMINKRAQPGNAEFDTLIDEIKDVYTAEYAYVNKRGFSRYGQIEYSLFNKSASSEALKLIVLGWGSNYRLPVTQRGIAALALADENQRFAVCNFMGRGESTPLPFSRSMAVARSGSFIPAGELFYDALEQSGVLSDTASGIDIVGESEGHRLAVGAVASGLTVQRGTFVDGPGMSHLGLLRLAHGLQVKEAKHNRQYVNQSSDQWSKEPDEASLQPHSKLELMKRGTALSQYILHPIGMAKAGLNGDTHQALGNIKEDLTIISLELSEITNHEEAEHMMESLATEDLRPSLLRHRVAKGLTHAVAMAGPGARSQLLLTEQDVSRSNLKETT